MDFKELFLYIELPLCALVLIETIVLCYLLSRQRHLQSRLEKPAKMVERPPEKKTEKRPEPKTESSAADIGLAPIRPAAVQEPALREPMGYASGVDAFLDKLTTKERNEFYNLFVYNSRCGLKYKPGEDNGEFFSGVFINLSGIMYVTSESLMRKICVEYDRTRNSPVTENI